MRLSGNDVGPPLCIWTKLDKCYSLSYAVTSRPDRAQLGKPAVPVEQLVSTEQFRRQMVLFAYSRGLGPVLTMANHLLGLTMQLLAPQGTPTEPP